MGLDSFRSGTDKNDSSDIQTEELKEVFPTVELINDEQILNGIVEYKNSYIPDYFWKAPATSSNKYHHPASRNVHGLWAHTLMGATALEEQKWTYMEMSKISHHEMDCARAAILLHDTRKYGDTYWDSKSADNDHDIQAAERARSCSFLPETVAECIESHMGPSYAGPAPRNDIEMMVHKADMIASTSNITPAVYKPPEVIACAIDEMDITYELRD